MAAANLRNNHGHFGFLPIAYGHPVGRTRLDLIFKRKLMMAAIMPDELHLADRLFVVFSRLTSYSWPEGAPKENCILDTDGLFIICVTCKLKLAMRHRFALGNWTAHIVTQGHKSDVYFIFLLE